MNLKIDDMKFIVAELFETRLKIRSSIERVGDECNRNEYLDPCPMGVYGSSVASKIVS